MLERLERLRLDDARRRRLGCAGPTLTLRRAWPRSPDHLLLEYVDDRGRVLPGQWLRDPEALRRVADETARRGGGAPVAVVAAARAEVLLQPGGADRKLPGLAAILARPDATLISHRPERRAVARLDGTPPRYAKVVRPSRLPGLMVAARRVAGVAGEWFDVPRVLTEDPEQGVVIWSALEGPCLFDRLGDPALSARACHSAGRALRQLHDAPGSGTAAHDASAESALLRRCLEHLEHFAPASHGTVSAAAPSVLAALADHAAPSRTIHRDFYDKQIIILADGRSGMLDADTLADGEAALDVANMLIHLELRGLQGRGRPADLEAAAGSFLDGYGAEDGTRRRLSAYADASRLRLACLYAFRPRWRHLVPTLVERIGAPCCGTVAEEKSGARA